MGEERLLHGTFHQERRTLMQMVERHQRGAFLLGRRIHTLVVDGMVEVAVEEEAEEIGAAITGGVRHLEGRMTIPMTGRRTLG